MDSVSGESCASHSQRYLDVANRLFSYRGTMTDLSEGVSVYFRIWDLEVVEHRRFDLALFVALFVHERKTKRGRAKCVV